MQSGHFRDIRSTRAAGIPTAVALTLITAGLTLLMAAGICAAAILAHAPAAVVPLVIVGCIVCPVFALWEVPGALADLRAERAGGKALARFRRSLAQLPETEHPLGL